MSEEHAHSYSWVETGTSYGSVIKDGKELCIKTVYSEERCPCGDVRSTRQHTEAC